MPHSFANQKAQMTVEVGQDVMELLEMLHCEFDTIDASIPVEYKHDLYVVTVSRKELS